MEGEVRSREGTGASEGRVGIKGQHEDSTEPETLGKARAAVEELAWPSRRVWVRPGGKPRAVGAMLPTQGTPHPSSGDLGASLLPLPSHCPYPHRFNWKAGAPLDWGIPGRAPPRGSSWSGVGVGESPKAPSTVTPAGDRSVSGCWLSSCLKAPCCPEGLRRFWLRSQLAQ